MKNQHIAKQLVFNNRQLGGFGTQQSTTRLRDLQDVFMNEGQRASMAQDTLVYEVEAHLPVAAGTEGGLFFGLTKIHPGKVGQEYFMTRGHFHALANRTEYYWCLNGKGILLLMDTNRNTRMELMEPGILNYIPPYTAHRVANIGNELLTFAACWPADAGHNYEEIRKNGFSARLIELNGQPKLTPTN